MPGNFNVQPRLGFTALNHTTKLLPKRVVPIYSRISYMYVAHSYFHQHSLWLQITKVFKVWSQIQQHWHHLETVRNSESLPFFPSFSASVNQYLSFSMPLWWFEHTFKIEKHECKISFLNLIRQKPYLVFIWTCRSSNFEVKLFLPYV